MTLFEDPDEANLRSCTTMVEDAIRALGHDPDASRLPDATPDPAWRVQKGSAHVFIQFHGRGDGRHLRIVAPVMHVDPAHHDVPALYRRLLELNSHEVYGAAFALKEGTVVLVGERTTAGLDGTEVLDLVRRIEEYADHYDDTLVAEFGGRVAGLSTAPLARR